MTGQTGIKSLLFSFVALAAFSAATAYALKHREQLYRNFALLSGKELAAAKAKKPETAAEESETSHSSDNVELKANASGHFETSAEINGQSVDVMVDTGATMVALTWEDAEHAGIYLKDSDFTYKSQTANGTAKIAMVHIEKVSVGNITVRNVEGAVAERGKLKQTLLGMSFLKRLDKVEMHGKTLILHE